MSRIFFPSGQGWKRLKARLSALVGSCHHCPEVFSLVPRLLKVVAAALPGAVDTQLPVSSATMGLHGPSSTQLLQTPRAEGHTLQVLMQPGTRRKFELYQTSINSCFQLLRYKGPNVILNVS